VGAEFDFLMPKISLSFVIGKPFTENLTEK